MSGLPALWRAVAFKIAKMHFDEAIPYRHKHCCN